MQYRRAFLPGGSFFFTAVTHDRQPLFHTADNVEVLREAFRVVKTKHPFEVDAVVILPDHLHCIWTLPPDDADFSTRWRLIKTWFTKHLGAGETSGYAALTRPKTEEVGRIRRSRNPTPVWQQRYWEHTLRDKTDLIRHVEYIHFNPVKHGYATSALDWPYSSFRRYVENGIYPAEWGAAEADLAGIGHE
jgi:putative transposase